MTRRRRSIGTLKNGTLTSLSIPEGPAKRSGARSVSSPLSPKQTIARIHVTGNSVATPRRRQREHRLVQFRRDRVELLTARPKRRRFELQNLRLLFNVNNSAASNRRSKGARETKSAAESRRKNSLQQGCCYSGRIVRQTRVEFRPLNPEGSRGFESAPLRHSVF